VHGATLIPPAVPTGPSPEPQASQIVFRRSHKSSRVTTISVLASPLSAPSGQGQALRSRCAFMSVHGAPIPRTGRRRTDTFLTVAGLALAGAQRSGGAVRCGRTRSGPDRSRGPKQTTCAYSQRFRRVRDHQSKPRVTITVELRCRARTGARIIRAWVVRGGVATELLQSTAEPTSGNRGFLPGTAGRLSARPPPES
jgi:hypothetical protein